MGKRKDSRLAYSEYVVPHHQQNIAVRQARRVLMNAVRLQYRPMLEWLLSDVFPHYSEMAESGFDFDKILWHPHISPCTVIPEGPLKSTFSGWAKQFHAEQDWFLDEILQILRGWYVAQDWREGLQTRNPVSGTHANADVGTGPFSFSYGPWEPELSSWTEYERKLREELDKNLAEYERTGRKLAEAHGLVLAPRQYSPINLNWFVLYQFQGLSSTEIANLDSAAKAIDESTVLKGIHSAARLIGWTRLRSR